MSRFSPLESYDMTVYAGCNENHSRKIVLRVMVVYVLPYTFCICLIS
jgi:hypothetical protein